MPRGNRTGPRGAGPRTGRGAGFCSGYDTPGFSNPGLRGGGFGGGGFGFGGRGGRGWRNMYYATGQPGWVRGGFTPPPPPTAEEEVNLLQNEASWLKEQLDAINQRIAQMGKKEE